MKQSPASLLGLAAVMSSVCVPSVAKAQAGLIVQPVIPQGFERDRNVSVLERSRPSYNPIGISVGGLLFYPEVRAGAGATTNAYLAEREGAQAAFFSVEPSLRITSIWSRHSLQLNGSTLLRNYVSQTRRNEREWNLDASGQVELGRNVEIDATINASQETEDPFSGEVENATLALSRFRRNFASVRVAYTGGRIRLFGLSDYTDYRFRPVPLQDGSFREQSGRDRHVVRSTVQFEYAKTPSLSFFAQLSSSSVVFGEFGSDSAGLESRTNRILGGFNFDLSGRARGTIGLGYSIRDYRLPEFENVRGPAVEARLELFPNRLTTITISGRRSVEDVTAGNIVPRPFWNNRLTLRADYELLNNLIVSGFGDYGLQSYIAGDQRTTTRRLRGEARYLLSRRLTLDGSLGFTKRQSTRQQSNQFDEGRVEAGVSFHI